MGKKQLTAKEVADSIMEFPESVYSIVDGRHPLDPAYEDPSYVLEPKELNYRRLLNFWEMPDSYYGIVKTSSDRHPLDPAYEEPRQWINGVPFYQSDNKFINLQRH